LLRYGFLRCRLLGLAKVKNEWRMKTCTDRQVASAHREIVSRLQFLWVHHKNYLARAFKSSGALFDPISCLALSNASQYLFWRFH